MTPSRAVPVAALSDRHEKRESDCQSLDLPVTLSQIFRKPELFLSEKILGFVCFNELLREDIGSGLWRFLHTDALYHTLSSGLGREGSDCFLCHNSNSSDYLISR